MSMLRRWNREQNSNGHIPVRPDDNDGVPHSLRNFEQRVGDLFENFLGEMEQTLTRISSPAWTPSTPTSWGGPSGINPSDLGWRPTNTPAANTVNTVNTANTPTPNTPGVAGTGRIWGTGSVPAAQPNLNGPSTGWEGFTPYADFSETDEEYCISCDLPGMSREDIEVVVSNNSVVLRGERSADTEQVQGNYHQRERQYGVFYRDFPLPGDVDLDEISAEFDNGVLLVSLPKTEEARKSRRSIDISSK